MYKKLNVDHITNRLNIKGDVNLDTNAGKALYSIAKLDEVNNFLELGTQFGTSAECISWGLKESAGSLHTVEFIKDRYEYAKKALSGFSVTCHYGKSFGNLSVDSLYRKEGMSNDGLLEKLVSVIDFNAAFLDTCAATQNDEFTFIDNNTTIKYVVMHEPNIKCPTTLNRLRNSDTWELLEDGTDDIRGHRVYYTVHKRK